MNNKASNIKACSCSQCKAAPKTIKKTVTRKARRAAKRALREGDESPVPFFAAGYYG